ncbi:MAG: NAD(P)-binding domain-containing protein, partial [Bacteroidia bacterium]
MSDKKIGIVGSGSWATALAKLLLNNSENISWFVRHPEDVEFFKAYKHNPKYLSSCTFNTDKISFYTDLSDFLKTTDIVILAVPSAFIHNTLIQTDKNLIKDKFFFSAIKGIVPEFN